MHLLFLLNWENTVTIVKRVIFGTCRAHLQSAHGGRYILSWCRILKYIWLPSLTIVIMVVCEISL